MKKVLRESGLKPDEHDKERESRLIAKLVRLEKQLKSLAEDLRKKKKKL